MQGAWYCGPDCLEGAIAAILLRERPVTRMPMSGHRLPLGLLLLSRHQLNDDQLRAALKMQRAAGSGKIGEWLQHLRFVDEDQVTGALARQWSCPVLKTLSSWPIGGPTIPFALLDAAQMVPAGFTESTGTFLMAFSDAVDHTTLYAVEQMLQVRTSVCFITPRTLHTRLQALSRTGMPKEVVFDRTEDLAECARIIRNYAARASAEEVRLIRSGKHIWAQLYRPTHAATNILFKEPDAAPRTW